MSSDIAKAWQRTRSHLEAAGRAWPNRDRGGSFEEFLEHNELGLAADELLNEAESAQQAPAEFWNALALAYSEMKALVQSAHCRWRGSETKFGYIEAELTLWNVTSLGRRRERAITSGLRPDWDVGLRNDAGELEITGAPLTVEGRSSLALAPGETGIVRLHPIHREYWTRVGAGMKLNMHEGPHVCGQATVTRVELKGS